MKGLESRDNVPTIIATIAMLCKHSNYEEIKSNYPQITSLIQKCSLSSNIEIKSWALYALYSSLKRHGINAVTNFKVSFSALS